MSKPKIQSNTKKEGKTLMKQLKKYPGLEYKPTLAKKEKP